jgi:hypothetical protein
MEAGRARGSPVRGCSHPTVISSLVGRKEGPQLRIRGLPGVSMQNIRLVSDLWWDSCYVPMVNTQRWTTT